MAENQYVSKVVFGNDTLIDLTSDTVTAGTMLSGTTAHDASGAPVTGTCSYDVNSQDATVQVAEMLSGKTAYARGAKLTGSMPNNGSVSLSISTVNGEATVAQGYHDGSGRVSIAAAEKAKIIASNILSGVTILGVTGSVSPSSSVTAQSRTVTPTRAQQSVLPESGYDYLSEVVVNAIPYVETDNSAGGKTVTIAG